MGALEISYLIEVCGMIIGEAESNDSAYERCGMIPCGNGVKCNVVE